MTVIISEETLQNNNIIIIKKGLELFHSTVEVFDKKNVRPGAYDNVFWTTNDSAISQTYIPQSGSLLYTTSKRLANPSNHDNIQNQLGIKYIDVKFKGSNVDSYREAKVFEKYSDETYEIQKISMQKYTNLKKYQDKHWSKLTDEDLKNYSKAEQEYEDILNLEKEHDLQKFKNQYVNKKLENLGYKPVGIDNKSSENFHWILKIDDEILKPANYKAKGRLFIVIPKKDLKIYDTTDGGRREGDLTDVDYHKHDWFETAQKAEFDGIKINDFAQSEDMGNVMHTSIGLFKDTLKFVDIEEVDAYHNDLQPHYNNGDFESPEYKKYKRK